MNSTPARVPGIEADKSGDVYCSTDIVAKNAGVYAADHTSLLSALLEDSSIIPEK